MVFSHQSKTATRQMLNQSIERHHRNAPVQHLSCRLAVPGVKGIVGMDRFNICLVVVLLWCENTIRLKWGGGSPWFSNCKNISGDSPAMNALKVPH